MPGRRRRRGRLVEVDLTIRFGAGRSPSGAVHREAIMLFERFYDAGAGAYDRVFGRIPRDFSPALLRMARLTPGLRVLDIATGTGIFAEAAAAAVGPSGHLVAADLSPS